MFSVIAVGWQVEHMLAGHGLCVVHPVLTLQEMSSRAANLPSSAPLLNLRRYVWNDMCFTPSDFRYSSSYGSAG
jgi:hypothetical protein